MRTLRRLVRPRLLILSAILLVLLLRIKDPVTWDSLSHQDDPVPSRLQVDLVAVGSQARADYMNAQRASFGSHVIVRRFIAVDENDDADPHCSTSLTADDTYAISRWCRTREVKSDLQVAFRDGFWTEHKLRKYSSPSGWLCAQRRPIVGLYKALANLEKLPDYLVIMDDDTFLDMDVFEQEFLYRQLTNEPRVWSGCAFANTVMRFHWGGYGLILNMAAMERLVEPMDENMLEQMRLNIIGEAEYYQPGISLLELFYRHQQGERYTDYRQWHSGYCMHSDWTTAYMVQYYRVAEELSLYMESLVTSKETTGNCRQGKQLPCPVGSAACHPLSAAQMHELTNAKKVLYPDNYRSD